MSTVGTAQRNGDIPARDWLCLCYVLIVPAAPIVSLCAVNIYQGIYSNETG